MSKAIVLCHKPKAANPEANTTADEEKIDQLVCTLYGLTDAEIATVEKENQ